MCEFVTVSIGRHSPMDLVTPAHLQQQQQPRHCPPLRPPLSLQCKPPCLPRSSHAPRLPERWAPSHAVRSPYSQRSAAVAAHPTVVRSAGPATGITTVPAILPPATTTPIPAAIASRWPMKPRPTTTTPMKNLSKSGAQSRTPSRRLSIPRAVRTKMAICRPANLAADCRSLADRRSPTAGCPA